MTIMKPERGGSRGGMGLAVLGVVWFCGTVSLAYAALFYGFALMGASSRNGELAQVLIYAALALGSGAPVVGLLVAMHLRNKAGILVYGLIVLGLVALVLVTMSKGRSNHVYKQDPPICTAPPERAAGVPGC
jgi:hypothetical protein